MVEDPSKSPDGGYTGLVCTDGRDVWLEVSRTPELIIRVGEDERASLPYPPAGYGGHELLLSPKETYLALWLYSGQSETGYELFQFHPRLEHLVSFPYVRGIGRGPTFSEDEARLALAWATNTMLNAEEAELDEEGRTIEEHCLAWAGVHVRRLPDGACSHCRIDVRLPAGWPYEGDDYYEPENLSVTAHEVRLDTPWGVEARIPFPLPESLTIDGPRHRPA